MNELLTELEEDMRASQRDAFFARFGRVMIVVSVVVIIAVAWYVWREESRKQAQMEITRQFIKAVEREYMQDYAGAALVLESLVTDKEVPHYGVAMLRLALVQQKVNPELAGKTLETLKETDAVYGALAALLVPAQGKMDKPERGTPFYTLRAEMRGWRLLEASKREEAVSQFLALYEDNTTPMNIRLRLTEVLQHLAPAQLAEVDAKLRRVIDAREGAKGEKL